MTQHDYFIDSQPGASLRQDVQNAFQALASCNSGAEPPPVILPGMFWLDTSHDLLRVRNRDNNAWLTVGRPGPQWGRFEDFTCYPALRDVIRVTGGWVTHDDEARTIRIGGDLQPIRRQIRNRVNVDVTGGTVTTTLISLPAPPTTITLCMGFIGSDSTLPTTWGSWCGDRDDVAGARIPFGQDGSQSFALSLVANVLHVQLPATWNGKLQIVGAW